MCLCSSVWSTLQKLCGCLDKMYTLWCLGEIFYRYLLYPCDVQCHLILIFPCFLFVQKAYLMQKMRRWNYISSGVNLLFKTIRHLWNKVRHNNILLFNSFLNYVIMKLPSYFLLNFSLKSILIDIRIAAPVTFLVQYPSYCLRGYEEIFFRQLK